MTLKTINPAARQETGRRDFFRGMLPNFSRFKAAPEPLAKGHGITRLGFIAAAAAGVAVLAGCASRTRKWKEEQSVQPFKPLCELKTESVVSLDKNIAQIMHVQLLEVPKNKPLTLIDYDDNNKKIVKKASGLLILLTGEFLNPYKSFKKTYPTMLLHEGRLYRQAKGAYVNDAVYYARDKTGGDFVYLDYGMAVREYTKENPLMVYTSPFNETFRNEIGVMIEVTGGNRSGWGVFLPKSVDSEGNVEMARVEKATVDLATNRVFWNCEYGAREAKGPVFLKGINYHQEEKWVPLDFSRE